MTDRQTDTKIYSDNQSKKQTTSYVNTHPKTADETADCRHSTIETEVSQR